MRGVRPPRSVLPSATSQVPISRHSIRPASLSGAILALVGTLLLRAPAVLAQVRPDVHLPAEAVGMDAIVDALLAAYDHVPLIALGEAHERRVDSALRLALVRHPDFAKRVRVIVIECAAVTEQATLDRYIRGATVPSAQLARVWRATAETTNGFCDAAPYPAFLAAIRTLNARLEPSARIRVLGGHPGPGAGPGIEGTAARVLENQVFGPHQNGLVIFGAAHFFLDAPPAYYTSVGADMGLARRLNRDHPGQILTVIPIGDLPRPPAVQTDTPPDYAKLDRALKSTARPVLVSLQRPPFSDFTAEEFLGRTLTTCLPPGGCRSVFKGSPLTLRGMADAAIYVGSGRH